MNAGQKTFGSNLRKGALAAGLALLLAAPAWADGVLNRGNRFEPASLDPAKANTQYERAIVGDLFEGLATFSADGRPAPGVAAAWQIEPGGLRYQFRLRPGVQWSDGTPITAEDVVFSFRRLMDPKTASPAAQLLYVLKNGRAVNTGALPGTALGVTATDTDLVLMDLEGPAPYLIQLLANPFAAIVPKHTIDKAGDAWTKAENMVTSGAFTLQSWLPQDKIVLIRNPKFHDAKTVKLDTVNYFPTADLAAALTRFKAGELDMQIEFPTNQIEALREGFPKSVKLTPALLTYYLAVNTTNPKFADPRVRRALSLAIDRDVLTQKVLRTGEIPAASFVPPLAANYRPPRLDFFDKPEADRLAEAKRLLGELGYGAGKPLKITYSHSANTDLRRIAVVIAGMWKRIGVETQLYSSEGKVFFSNLRQGDFEVGFVAWLADFNDAANFLTILEAGAAPNYSRYNNPAFDKLMSRARDVSEPPPRLALLSEAEQLLLADQPVIPLYFGATKNLIAPQVGGWQPNPLDVHLSRYLTVTR